MKYIPGKPSQINYSLVSQKKWTAYFGKGKDNHYSDNNWNY